MKKTYVVPRLNTENAVPVSVLVSSDYESSEDVFAVAIKNGWDIKKCPFNNQRCKDKQRSFNNWCQAVEYYAKNRVDYTFHTRSGMFDRCPHGYSALCAQHEQKQRG